ncbi:MAG: molybdopterin-dependent oxidoreductase [Candidatus Bathyarchaeia archaeon]
MIAVYKNLSLLINTAFITELLMEVLKRKTMIALILIIIVIISAISVAFFVQNQSKPSSTASPSPTPTSSSTSTQNSPTPTTAATSTLLSTPSPMPTNSLFPDEVTQYQGQSLTALNTYIYYLYQHPDVAIKGAQNVDKDSYRLAITGLVNNTINYTYDEVVNDFNSTLEVATLPCVEGWSVTLLWQGVQITDLLAHANVSSKSNTLIFVAADGYTTSLTLDYVKQNNITIAYKMNNVTLTPQTGFPFFLVAKNQYGYKWIEWLTEINVSNNTNYLGYWESRGYPNNARVSNPGNASPLLINSPITLTAITISIICIIVAVALLVSRHKLKKR